MAGAAVKCAECPNCHLRYVFQQHSPWLGKNPVRGGNEHRLFCLCGEISYFDFGTLKRYLVSVEVLRRGYGSPEEVPLQES